MIIDSHCHLDQRQFQGDQEAVIQRALAAGVEVIVNPGTDLAASRAAVALAESHAQIYAAVGIHPNDCAGFDDAGLTALRELAGHPKVVAIGEIGLDYYWDAVPHDEQKQALRAQLALATELNLPVILHSREAMGDLMWELEQWVSSVPTPVRSGAMLGVLHAFSGDLDAAERAYALGFLLGLGGPVTFQNARTLHALVPQLRRDRLMLETDAPYLAPHPHRGKRNEPAFLPLIAQSLATLMGTTVEQLTAETSDTARRFFRITQ
jgi:TatD DNase family protein